MLHRIMIVAAVAVVVVAGSAGASTRQGDSEIALSGSLTRTDYKGSNLKDDTMLFAQLAYGHFFTDAIEVLGQAFGMWTDEGQSLYDLGVSGKYHFLTDRKIVPYVGGQANAAIFMSGNSTTDTNQVGLMYGPLGGAKFFVSENTTVFAEYQYPGIPKMRLNQITDYGFTAKGITLTPLRVFHYRLPVYGFRIGNFAYITDANYVPEETKEKLFGIKYLVINALRKEKHISHFSLREAVDLIKEIAPRKAFITHISHQMGFHEEVSAALPPGIMLAYDGLSFFCDE